MGTTGGGEHWTKRTWTHGHASGEFHSLLIIRTWPVVVRHGHVPHVPVDAVEHVTPTKSLSSSLAVLHPREGVSALIPPERLYTRHWLPTGLRGRGEEGRGTHIGMQGGWGDREVQLLNTYLTSSQGGRGRSGGPGASGLPLRWRRVG